MQLSRRQYINLFHLLIVAPTLLYVGISHMKKRRINDNWYTLLIIMGIAVLLYHGYTLFKSLRN